jgi:hypothetical protein
MVATSTNLGFGTNFLNQTAGANTSAFWDPSSMGSTWNITPPSTSASTTASTAASAGGSMAFPWMAAATVAAPVLSGLFGSSAARSQRAGAQEALGVQSALQQDALLAGFGAQERARDNERNRQLARGIDQLNLRNTAPYLADMSRTAGFELAGRGFSPAQVSQWTDMFGGYS